MSMEPKTHRECGEKPAFTSPSVRKLVRHVPLEPHQHLTEITSAKDVFVLAHVGVPQARAEDWWLEITGLVKPSRFSFSELIKLPKREVTAFHQCAGFPLSPHIATRRLANVIWGGVDLATLLKTAKVSAEASHLWSFGVDYGRFQDVEATAYVKDLPLSRISSGNILLAYEMNGEPLSHEHGFPIRLIVPGYYGTNSVKWLYRLELASQRHDGPYTKILYNDPVPPSASNSWNKTRPLWEIPPESFIVSPAPNAEISQTETEIWGWTWGDVEIDHVEVSADGGQTWQTTEAQPRTQHSWQKFKMKWKPRQPGATTILSCAVDKNGVRQKEKDARNAIYGVDVQVISKEGAIR